MPEKSAAEKLQVKSGRRIRVVTPPADWQSLLGGLPGDVKVLDDSAAAGEVIPADVVIFFASGSSDLQTLLPGLRPAMTPDGMIWVAYHKGTSRVKTDINRDSINSYAHGIGLRGVAIVSINDDWAALRLKAF